MSATARPLLLYDLLAPLFLGGFQFVDEVDAYLSVLTVSDLDMASDGDAVLYTGAVVYPLDPNKPPPKQVFFDLHDVTIRFRLRIPRAGSTQVQTWIGNNLANTVLSDLKDATAALGSPTSAATDPPTDYPGLAFELELLLTAATFHMGEHWLPAVYDDTTFEVAVDTTAAPDVKFLLPKVLFRFAREGQDYTKSISFRLESWGDAGFDAPHDLAEGECVTMDPPLAIHSSRRVAFGVDDVILDLSPNGTPPEILSHFGADESFEGIYVKALQFYYCDKHKDTALNFMIKDALISFKGEVSLEAELDLVLPDRAFGVNFRVYDGRKKLPVDPGHDTGAPSPTWAGGSIRMTPTSVLYLQVKGGTPPFDYKVQFVLPSNPLSPIDLWDNARRLASLDPLSPVTSQTATLVVTVTDSGVAEDGTTAAPQTYSNTLTLHVVNAPAELGPPGQAVWMATASIPPGAPAEYQILFTPSSSGSQEILTIAGAAVLPTVLVDNITPYTLGPDRRITLDVQPGSPRLVSVTYPPTAMPASFPLYFAFDQPASDTLECNYYGTAGHAPDPAPADDPVFVTNKVPEGTPNGSSHGGADALRYWAQTALVAGQPITIDGWVSNAQDPVSDKAALSQRRADVAKTIVASATSASISAVGHGMTSSTSSLATDNVAIVTGTANTTPTYQLTGNLSRSPGALPQPVVFPKRRPPGPPSNKKPRMFRRLSFRVRLQRNEIVLAEIGGEIDFQTAAERKIRDTPGSGADQTEPLGLEGTPAAVNNPNPPPWRNGVPNGLVDFVLNVTYDSATHDLTETLTLGAAQANADGLLRMTNPNNTRLRNLFGGIMILTPVLDAAIAALDPKSAGDWKAITAAAAVPATLGALNVLKTEEAVLFGGELKLRQNIPGDEQPTLFTNAALTFDYGVWFNIDIHIGSWLNIHSEWPLFVHYGGVGIALNFHDQPEIKIVLDTSKGYALTIDDPGLLTLPGPLGKILKIASAVIAQFNPLTLELDLEIKADLGIVTVDKFKVKIPFDGGKPMIVPSGVRVNIPSTLIGNGSVAFDAAGMSGSLDLTLVPLKLRVRASVGFNHVQDPSRPAREATAVFLGLEIDFPTPIMLGASGLGLQGLFGLFGMHYDRVLSAVAPDDPVGPDLKWLEDSQGTPYMLQVTPPQQATKTLWSPKLDNWAFGVGAQLGTLDGYLLNLRGAMILELPGPRLLATVNVKLIEDIAPVMPSGMDATSLEVGIVGILDLDFVLDQITIGIMVDLEITDLLSAQIPIQIFFNWDRPEDWHVWIGTIQVPASARILNIVRGAGYFMIGGQAISPFPPGSSSNLPGVAVAMGISASVVWGDEAAGIYLRVALSADFGVSFEPHLFIVGHIHVEGELRLVVVSIGATGDFLLTGPNPVFLEVHICGHVKLFFFKLEACVDFQIGTMQPAPAPPPPIANMYLQSFAPVIAAGQGSDRPIDASLGTAVAPGGQDPPVVPIDSVPVLQMLFGMDASAVSQTFTAPIPACPTYPGGAGVNIGGGRRVRYRLTALSITPPLPAGVVPPAVWRPNKPGSDMSQTRVDLALFSRNPNVTNSALERSDSFSRQLATTWANTCVPIAKPVCVLWTLCGQRLGPSPVGWTLTGTPWPDLPDTRRDASVPVEMTVEQPVLDPATSLMQSFALKLGGTHIDPAQVIGDDWSDVVSVLSAMNLVGVYNELDLAGLIKKSHGKTLPCLRALELPRVARQPQLYSPGEPIMAPGSVPAAAQVVSLEANNRWLRFTTNFANRIRMLLGLDPPTFAQIAQRRSKTDFVIRELSASGQILRQTSLYLLLAPMAGPPNPAAPTWTDPNGPWRTRVREVTALLLSQNLMPVFVEFVPDPETITIEIAIRPVEGDFDLPSRDRGKRPDAAPVLPASRLAVGAVEVCPASEVDRYNNALSVQHSTVAAIDGYLNGAPPPLLDPATTYTIAASYTAVVTEADGSTGVPQSGTQSFQFVTDNTPPAALAPWVLCSAPDMAEQNVFYRDPVQILLNDISIIQLFAKYGYQLKMNLHAADGLPEPSTGTPVASALNPVPGVGPATYDSMRALAQSDALFCIGATTQYQNQMFTLPPLQLRPLMAYTLDIVTDPAQASIGDVDQPLYRRAFATSKYPSMAALAADLGAGVVKHRALAHKLGFPLAPGKTVRPDQDIQDAFVAAGEQALPAPSANAITIYWAQDNGAGPYRPQAVVLDCTEPLWRERAEPIFAQPDPQDPSLKTVTIAPVTALEVLSLPGSGVAGFIVSPAGTRTIAMLANGFAGAVTLALHRPPSAYYSPAEETDTIVTLQIAAAAPWESDHV